MESFKSDLFSDFLCFCKPAVKLSKQGRASGGIVCLIKNVYASFVRVLDVNYSNVIVVLVDKTLFGSPKDILYVCAYVPPEGSPFYAFFDLDNGVDMLEDCLTNCLLDIGDVFIIMSGDLNSRTSNISPDVVSSASFLDAIHKSNPTSVNRNSQDKVLNNYGKLLLNVCTTLGLSIMNGVCNGDRQGCYTFITDSGSSVNDYFILSNDLLNSLFLCCELTVKERFDSDHMPLEFQLSCSNDIFLTKPDEHQSVQTVNKLVWNERFTQTFVDSMNSDECRRMLESAIFQIDSDVDQALDTFNKCIRKSAYCMSRQFKSHSNQRPHDWFDQECRSTRTNLRKLYRTVRRSGKPCDQHSFSIARREYKRLIKRKEKDFNNALLDKLLLSINEQKEFWGNVNKVMGKKKTICNNISLETWFDHFKKLLEKDCDPLEEEYVHDNTQESESYFNRPISREEVLFAVRKIKNRKAAGPDGIIGELLKNAGEYVIDFFVKFFNVLFQKGIFPEKWSEGIVLPLYKKGNVNDPNNYRGITLCDISSKMYSTIINFRLQEWVEENNITGEIQAGFKRNYSTIDHMFTLLALIQKQLSLGRKLYVAFIDFEKAFDSVNRKLLWSVLIKNGIDGKLYNCIKSMYNNVKVRIRSGFSLTECVNCTYGVKQGDVCSPILFSLFINELAMEVIRCGKHGALFTIDYFELFILLLADDVALLSETVVGLQTQLNSLQRASSSLDLKININKSNIVVFRNGGYLSAREKWVLNNMEMPVVNAYKYLGILFSTRLSFALACSDLTSRAKNAALSIMHKLRVLNVNDPSVLMRIFDSQIQPIAQYGSELWGLEDAACQCEKVHLFFLKHSWV